MADTKSQIARQHEDNRKHGTKAGAAWIVLAIVIAVVVVGAIYWSSHDSNTASNPAPQTSGSAVNSRFTTGSGTSSTGGR